MQTFLAYALLIAFVGFIAFGLFQTGAFSLDRDCSQYPTVAACRLQASR